MEYDVNRPRSKNGSGTGFGRKAGLPMRKGKAWIWVVLAVVFVCAVTVTVAAALGLFGSGDEKKSDIKGNAGVAAAYAFFRDDQDMRDKQASDIAKEIGKRLLSEPFEIESELNVGLDGMALPGIPLTNISVGLDAKYDMKDLGVKVSALGMEVFGGYVIDNNIVADVMGQAGSKTIEQADAEALKGNMGLKDRIYAFLPFLPKDDEVTMGLLEAVAASVPDKYTKTETQDVYSPKDNKTVSMEAITTTLDAKAIKESAGSLEKQVKDDVKLSGDIQRLIDGFTGFMGLDAMTIDDAFKSLNEALDSDDAENISIVWSVYSRNGRYVGIHVLCTGKDMSADYTVMSEFSGNDNYSYTKTDINGTKSENNIHSSWQGDKLKFEGDVTSAAGSGADEMTEHTSGSIEFARSDGGYSLTGDITGEGNASGIVNGTDSVSLNLGIEADIKVGGGLGTLKETRGWSDIYEKKWGSLEDLFNMFASGQGILGFGNPGSNL